jgi:hypothetical protein
VDEVVNIDGNDESANWPKRSWDFHGPVEYQASFVAGSSDLPLAEQQANVDRFMLAFVARAMPLKVKMELARRGLRVLVPDHRRG